MSSTLACKRILRTFWEVTNPYTYVRCGQRARFILVFFSRDILYVVEFLQLARPLVVRFADLFSRSFPSASNAAFLAAIDTALVGEDWQKLSRGLSKAINAALENKQSAALALREEWGSLAAAASVFDRHRVAMQASRLTANSSFYRTTQLYPFSCSLQTQQAKKRAAVEAVHLRFRS